MYVLGYGLGPLLFSPLSEVPQIGRNPIYIITFAIYLILSVVASTCRNFAGFIVVRFLQGFFGSPCLATGAASLSDMLSVIKIPYAMSAWSGAMYAGPALGPLLSGYAVVDRGWRWSMWEIVWLSGLVFVLLFAFLPETATPTLLHYKAKRLRQETGNSGYKAKGARILPRGDMARMALIKPFEITIKDPAIAFANLYTSFTYGIYYSFFEVFPLVYPKIYGMGTGDMGAVFLCVLIACILGAVWYCLWYRLTTEPRFRQLGTFDVQETFLKPGLIGVFGFPIGLFLFGWAARASVPWPVPTLGIVIVCGCSFVVGLGIFIHLPLSYPQYAASLFAANDALRSSFATAAILFGRPLYLNLGIGKGCSLLAAISAIGVAGFWYLYLHGDKLRKRSKFTMH
ncbi:Major facilitator superfamily domain, general substrate transporter [Akanthomyces lecanii RCEF 1005]|uniref:Major facilitator superfamily domain, general substrate transporter n=1 Tax=Akanthomyces lecanii RCEF 1005 TaxID=1081108 RepID=A0A168DU64_CORDF|nr:Major facilitator superfamily domain, general substrate transporter [Akanthomyces lecanii RCEF 1005]